MLKTLGEGTILLADSDRLRQTLSERGVFANVRPVKSRKRTITFQLSWLHRQRNCVDSFFSKLKHYRAVAIRYEKLRKFSQPSNSPPH